MSRSWEQKDVWEVEKEKEKELEEEGGRWRCSGRRR